MKILKNTISNLKHGFTLAEVLITLVIIGVVAAMTIPTLINKIQNRELVAGLKKANSVLSQAILKIGQNKDYPVGDYSFFKNVNFIDEFAKVVSVTKKCNTFSECFDKNTSGSNLYMGLNGNGVPLTDGKALITSDGQMFSYAVGVGAKYGISQQDSNDYIGRVLVDVNGRKPPNTFGKDMFAFYIIEFKGIVPAGSESTAECAVNKPGWSCAAKVLKENAINY